MSVAASALAVSAAASATEACAHCGAALASPERRFCCHGCEAAADLIQGLGLEAFYRRRAAALPGTLRPAVAGGEDDLTAFVQVQGDACRLQLHVEGLVCGACVWLVESALARDPAVREARVNFSTRRLTLAWSGQPAMAQALVRRLTAFGFRVAPFDAGALDDARAVQERELLRSMAIAGFAAANVMLLSVSVWSGHAGSMGPATREMLHWLSALIALPAIAFAGLPFFRSAIQAVAGGRTNMDVPISIGVTLAAGMSVFETFHGREHAFFDSAITLLFFLLVGRYLDMRARGRARHAAQHLVALATRAVRVLRGDGVVEVRRPEAVRVGDVVLVASGERVPVDGTVTHGETSLDQSIVTGESVPVPAAPGTRVFAGTVNLGQPIEVETRAAGEGTLLAEIARLMEAAERGQGRYVALADRVARLYAPVVHVTGAATFLVWWAFLGAPVHEALMYATAVLIITCPCALALAVPVVQVVASARLLRAGVLMKSATALERLCEVDTVVVDKTGTLTRGQPVLISDVDASALRVASGLAQASRHPLARAVVRAAPEAPLLPGVREHQGAGLSIETPEGEIRLGSRRFCGVMADIAADAALELWLTRPGAAPLRLTFSDALRVDASEAVAALRARGLELRLLSGDREGVVREVADRLGIAEWRAGATPAGKAAALSELAAAGRKVAMIGDGLNDAPALAAAHASLSPASAVDVAQVAADYVFQGDRLRPVVAALDLARASQRVARQNLALAIGYNVLAVPLAVAGFVTPLVAAIAMSSSSVIVIANALRLSREGE
jgi:Cu2+-exporting ATPase